MQAAEQVFRTFEIAMAIESMVAKQAAATVPAETQLVFDEALRESAMATALIGVAAAETSSAANIAKIPGNIAAGGSQMFAQSGWGGFVGVAAMLAVMASLGFGGGGGVNIDIAKERQKTQGTGTVLGDEGAKSESISHNLQLLSQNSDIALRHSSGMLSALHSIRDNIAGMAVLVSQSSGLRGTSADQRALGVGSSRSFLGFSSSSTSLDDSGIVFERLLMSDLEEARRDWTKAVWAPQTLGGILDSKNIYARGYSDLHKESSSWFGLSKSSSDEQILSDLDPRLKDQFVKTIEGLFAGVLSAGASLGADGGALSAAMRRVSLDDAGIFKVSLKGLSGADVEKELQAVFSKLGDVMVEEAMPGVKDFQKVGEGLFETLVRVANGTDVAKYALEQLGIAAIDYTSIVNKQGDVATEIIRQSLSAMEKVGSGVRELVEGFNGSADDLISTYKDLITVRTSMMNAGLNGDNLSRDTIRGAGGLDALKSATGTYLENFFSEAERNAAASHNLALEFEKLGLTMPASRDGFRSLVRSLDDGTEAGSRLVGKLLTLSGAFSDVAKATEAVALSAAELAMKGVEAAFAGLQRSVDAQKAELQKAYEYERAAIQKRAADLKAAAQEQAQAASTSLQTIQSIFNGIDSALKAVAPMSREAARSVLESALSFANAGGSLSKFSGLQDALQAFTKPNYQQFSSILDFKREHAQAANLLADLKLRAGDQVSVAQLTLDAINASITAIDTNAAAQLAALDTQHAEDIARLDGILAAAQLQIDKLNGIDNSILSLAQARSNFDNAARSAIAVVPTAAGYDPGWVTRATMAVQATLPHLDVGTNYVERSGLAVIHEGEAVVPKPYNPAAGGNAELVDEVRQLREDNKKMADMLERHLYPLVKHSMRSADALEDAVDGKRPLQTEAVYCGPLSKNNRPSFQPEGRP